LEGRLSLLTTEEGSAGFAAVRAAARLCEAVRAEMVEGAASIGKRDGSPVTVADFGAQALVCRTIEDRFPADTVVAEEDSAALQEEGNRELLATVSRFVGSQPGAATTPEEICRWIDRGRGEPADRFWVLDPIDGTKGFLRRDQYAVALALLEGNSVEWGFLACPALPAGATSGAIFVARRGHGAQVYALDGTPLGVIRVSRTDNQRLLRLVESVEAAHTNRGLSARLKEALATTADPVRMDSQAKYGVVARGQADVYLRSPNPRTPDYRENIWDHAAGALVVEEAGGRVTDVHGQPLSWNRGRRLEDNVGVVATNGRLHDEIIRRLEDLMRAPDLTS
jgi:3'(2'), 5'-bisphosphate nucleotidase